MENITIKQEIKLEDIADILCGALEGGSNYWYMIVDKVEPEHWTFYGTGNKENVQYAHLYPLNTEGALLINDERADEPTLKEPVRLDYSRVGWGLQRWMWDADMASHFADFMKGNYDATTADIFLQFCIFGKVIYG